MYRNLLAEMVRRGVKRQDIATAIGKSYNHTREKLNGKYPLEFREARIIRENFFSDLDLMYLFEEFDEI